VSCGSHWLTGRFAGAGTDMGAVPPTGGSLCICRQASHSRLCPSGPELAHLFGRAAAAAGGGAADGGVDAVTEEARGQVILTALQRIFLTLRLSPI
jgi:hypothetical protein